MQFAKLSIALLGITVVLAAADPFAATWKLNPAQSKFKTGKPAKDQTVKITESGSDLDVNITGTSADGAPISSHYAMPVSGGMGKMIESPSYDGISGKLLGPRQREISYSKGGKVVYTVRTTVSSDGKTMTAAAKGVNAAGQNVDGTSVYDKQ
jgi:hypothetical protein